MNKPNFFIVGAPKCGTTSLHGYLNQHPDIFMGPKDIHYFGSDLDYRNMKRPDLEDYLGYYSGAEGQRALGDATAWYLYSRNAAREIRDFSPDARIIMIFRNPVDVMYSLFSYEYTHGREDIDDFAEALAAEPDRRQGRRFTKSGVAILRTALLYREVVRFTEQAERYFSVFDRDRIHIILYDDLRTSTGDVYRSVLEFLAVDADFTANFDVLNANRNVRSKSLHRFLNVPQSSVQATKRIIPAPLLGALRPLWQRMRIGLRRYNCVSRKRLPMPPGLNASLKQEFLPEIERLSELTGRDLTAWCR